MILGVMKTAVPYEEGMVQLRDHDLLLLFTDGVSEAMSKEGEEYGEPRLEEVLHASGSLPPRRRWRQFTRIFAATPGDQCSRTISR